MMRRQQRHTTAGVDSEAFRVARPDDRVLTPDGPGTVVSVEDGFAPQTETYFVLLDDKISGGEYRANDISPMSRTTARRYSDVPLVCDGCGRAAQSSMSGGKQGHTMLCDACREGRGKAPRKATASSELVIRQFNTAGRGYWVGMRLPDDRDPDDFTMEEVTERYVTKRALEAAIANGTAWLSGKTARWGEQGKAPRKTGSSFIQLDQLDDEGKLPIHYQLLDLVAGLDLSDSEDRASFRMRMEAKFQIMRRDALIEYARFFGATVPSNANYSQSVRALADAWMRSEGYWDGGKTARYFEARSAAKTLGDDSSPEEVAAFVAAEAARHEPKITSDISSIVQSLGGKMEGLQFRLKATDSLIRKITDKGKAKGIKGMTLALSIQDAVRYTAVFPEDIYAVQVQMTLDALARKGYQTLTVENYWAKSDDYDGINTNLTIPGTPFALELQFHTDRSFRLKEEVIHGIYEQMRRLPDSNPTKALLFDLMARWSEALPSPPGVQQVGVPKSHKRPGPPEAHTHFDFSLDVPSWLKAARLVTLAVRDGLRKYAADQFGPPTDDELASAYAEDSAQAWGDLFGAMLDQPEVTLTLPKMKKPRTFVVTKRADGWLLKSWPKGVNVFVPISGKPSVIYNASSLKVTPSAFAEYGEPVTLSKKDLDAIRAVGKVSRTAARQYGLELEPKGSIHTAADDYPELMSILWDRPDLFDTEPVTSSKMTSLSSLRETPVTIRREAITPKELEKQLGDATRTGRVPPSQRTPQYKDGNPFPVYQTAQDAIDDPAQPWWWRKIVGPAVERYQQATGLSFDVSNAPSRDWCRFRKNSHCFYPRNLDEQATAEAGYAVWIPEDRGPCWRIAWKDQKVCSKAQPGPNSMEQVKYPDATVPWSQGGQRMPGGARRIGSLEVESSWRSVQSKARKIASEGRVNIIAQANGTITADVKGDSGVYQTSITRVPGTKQVALWTCGCPWSMYSWGRSGRWKKFEGRMCAHALALVYQAQREEIFGGDIKEQTVLPSWWKEDTKRILEQRAAPPGTWRLDVAAALEDHIDGLGVARRAVLTRTDIPAKTRAEWATAISASASIARTDLDALRSGLDFTPIHLASIPEPEMIPVTPFPVEVGGTVCNVRAINPAHGTCDVEGVGVIPTEWCHHPKYDPIEGLLPPAPNEPTPVSHAPASRSAAPSPRASIASSIEQIEDDIAWLQANGGLSLLKDEPEPALPRTEGESGDVDDEMKKDIIPDETLNNLPDIFLMSSKTEPMGDTGSREWLMTGGKSDNGDIANAARQFLAKTAVKDFSAAEQAEIIEEGSAGVRAANLDLLQIEGTHYQNLEANASDDDSILW